MSDFADSGVTGSASESGSGSDNSTAAPQVANEATAVQESVTADQSLTPEGQSQGEATPAPPAGDEIPENDDDLANLSEAERTPLLSQRQRLRELNALRVEIEPAQKWLAEIGGGDLSTGLQYAQEDINLVNSLYSNNPEERGQFYTRLFGNNPNQPSPAFTQLLDDMSTSREVQSRVINQLSNEQLMELAQSRGIALGNQQATTAAPEGVSPEVWNAIHPKMREDFDILDEGSQAWLLEQAQEKVRAQNERATAQRQAEAAQKQQYEAAVENYKTQTYTSIRSAVEKSLADKFQNDPQGLKFVLAATESVVWESEEGQRLWGELEAHIESGNERAFKQTLPLLVAQARLAATQQLEYFNGQQSKARQFDDFMRIVGNVDGMGDAQLVQHVRQAVAQFTARQRGGQRQPIPGTGQQVATNGNAHLAKPSEVGNYDPANILSYWPGR